MAKSNIQVFLGEPFQREQAIKETIEALESKEELGKYSFEGHKLAVAELQEALFAPSLFEPGRWVWLRHADEFDAATLLGLLEKNIPPEVHFLIDLEKLDKRSGLFKWLKSNANINEFAALDRRTLPGKIKSMLNEKKVNIRSDAFQYLTTTLPPDLVQIGQEIKKLKLFAKNNELTLEQVQGLLFGGQQANVFQFFDLLGERKPQALPHLRKLLESGEEASKLFFMLVNHMRSLLLIKALQSEGLRPPDIAKQSGSAPWMVNRRLQQTRQWSLEELIQVIHQLQEIDVQIKRGQNDPEDALLSLVLRWTKLVKLVPVNA